MLLPCLTVAEQTLTGFHSAKVAYSRNENPPPESDKKEFAVDIDAKDDSIEGIAAKIERIIMASESAVISCGRLKGTIAKKNEEVEQKDKKLDEANEEVKSLTEKLAEEITASEIASTDHDRTKHQLPSIRIVARLTRSHANMRMSELHTAQPNILAMRLTNSELKKN